MMQTVAQRGKYWYSYVEYLWASLLAAWFCCCFQGKQCTKKRVSRLSRYNQAVEKLEDEIDIVKLLYVQRIGQFIAKLILKKHQRVLVTNFQKFKVERFEDEDQAMDDKVVHQLEEGKNGLLGLQTEDGTLSDMALFEGDKNLTEAQLMLLQEIAERFSTEDDAADLSILYEITGYQAESQNFEFWSAYTDFEELGEAKLVRKGLNGEENSK